MEVVEGENNVPCESKDGCLDVVPKRLVGAPLRILLVDDFAPFRESIRQLFNGYDALMVVGEASDGYSAIEMTLRLIPHVIIMDVKMPRMTGIEATRRIKRALPAVHVVGVSSQEETLIKEAMQAAGSSAFVTKECAHTLPTVISKLTNREMDIRIF